MKDFFSNKKNRNISILVIILFLIIITICLFGGNKNKGESTVLSFLDYGTGEVALNKISEELNEMGRNGWRLKSTFTNEIGKTSESTRLGAVSSGTNATIEQTVFIFERKVPIVE